ncbi:MAG TPA: VTT domain-containing protein [Polyangia bacterium]|nr:VTT domain-containing protein [Polyangia bacterium]
MSFLIDGAAYFSALRQSIARARHSVFILGWDIDSRVRLVPESEAGDWPAELLPFLNQVLTSRPGLRVYLLGWDFSIIFTFERESLPWYRFSVGGAPGLRFHLDSALPATASHHQKIVVVDDRIAFAGGLDLAIRRWDTSEHRALHPDRVDPAQLPYPPVHDVQIAVDGQAARALGSLARERWRLATGEIVSAPDAGAVGGDHQTTNTAGDPWPTTLQPDVRSVPIAISRTMPHPDAPAVCEVLAMNLDAIAAARQWIYIENQYLTSMAIGDALSARLAEPDGPEVVAVLPRKEGGWMEQSSMGVLRAKLLQRLRKADRFGRLRVYYPTVPGLDGALLNVHAKVLIIDDRLLRVGSSNLSNRSVGLDSECDLVIDADDDLRLRPTVAGLRDRLLAEHLGCQAPAVAAALDARGSLVAAVESLRESPRTLQPLPIPEGDTPASWTEVPVNLAVLDGLVCDPERPPPDQIVEAFVPPSFRRPVHSSLLRYALVCVALLALAALWMFTPLRQYLRPQNIRELSDRLRDNPWAPFWVPAGYVAGTLVLFPITVLLTTTALIFDPVHAFLYCFGGALLASVVTYGVGRVILLGGRQRVAWLSGPRLAALRGHLMKRSLLAIVAARLLPIGNFSIINMVAGVLKVPLRTFVLGNAIGLLPGILALTVFANRLGRTLRHPHPGNLLVLGVVVVAIVALLAWMRRRITRLIRREGPARKHA